MQRAIWIVTFLIILAGAYFWIVVHENDTVKVNGIDTRLEQQNDNINTISEEQNRLDLRYIGHGKHLKEIQDEFHAHYDEYTKKMGQIDDEFVKVQLDMDDLGKRLTKKINEVKADIEDMKDEYDTNFRNYQRRISDLEKSKETTTQDIKDINALLLTIKEKLKIE